MQQQIQCYQQGFGEPVTLIHGWGMNSAVFEPLVPLLASQYEVIRVDLPGYGQSGWVKDADFDAQVEALAQVLPDSAVLGWSMGGLYALRLSTLYPERFKKLMLLSCNPCFVQRKNWLTAVEAAVFSEFSKQLEGDFRATIRRFLGLQVRGSAQARQLIRKIAELLMQGGVPSSEAMKFGLELLLRHDAREELAAQEVPVLAILGQHDTLVPVTLAPQLHRVNPSIRVECLAHAAHAPFLSHTDKVADLISEFIKPATTR
ncbi:MAG: pimeloyl-ACP methyl ester esterase BioH [Gammaproteobacteria bacterium]|nr:pimeloyl-ACP methyl ester esterase BioH [Gammaproteobacteria bacterium]MBL6998677.1 pimeloyl-ACP methyl ester esterase BioH [Gammaproteobacteria bacterium]